MAFTPGSLISAPAGADLHASSHLIAKLDVNGKAVLAALPTDDIAGVLDMVPQGATGLCSIEHVSGTGTFEVIAGASIAKGAYLTVKNDSSGQAVTATQTAAGSQPSVRVFGRARVAANSGDQFEYERLFFLY